MAKKKVNKLPYDATLRNLHYGIRRGKQGSRTEHPSEVLVGPKKRIPGHPEYLGQ